ncbi:MAG: hypothetical protein OES09_09820 [Gammaproteobacteria bacterium]|nr:hypothetical protein [Gammaproteobacteria bacterium]
MTPENRSSRTITTDFGPTVDCASNQLDVNGDCIIDAVGHTIECPHTVAARLNPGQCIGVRKVNLFFRDIFINANETTTIIAMVPDGNQYLGQHWDPEVHLVSEKRQNNGWVLIFKPNPGLQACDRDVAENLGITAFDSDGDGATDLWRITTDTSGLPGGWTTKIACVAKQGKNNRTFVGFVEMQFGFDIERLQ